MESSLNSTGDINSTVDSSLNSNLDSSLNTTSASDDSVMKLLEASTSEGENSIMEVVEQDEKKIEVPKKARPRPRPRLPPHIKGREVRITPLALRNSPFQTHRRVEPWGRLQDPATDELPIDWEAAG